jgi:hypothetical protein
MMNVTMIIPVHGDAASAKIVCELVALNVFEVKQIILVAEHADDEIFTTKFRKDLRKDLSIYQVLNKNRQGIKNSIFTAIEYSKSNDVIVYPADELMPIFALNEFIEHIRNGADFISATRYGKGGHRLGLGNWYGNAMSRFVSVFTRLLTNGYISDITTGIKAFKVNKLRDMPHFKSQGWAFLMEVELHSVANGIKIQEVPIISVDRFNGGISKFKPKSWTVEYIKVLFPHLLNLRRTRKST